MAITSLILNVSDLERSVRFYRDFLGVEPEAVIPDGAVLDAVTAKIRLNRAASSESSTWIPDDLQAGFRHIGFKVSDLDERVEGPLQYHEVYDQDAVDSDWGMGNLLDRGLIMWPKPSPMQTLPTSTSRRWDSR